MRASGDDAEHMPTTPTTRPRNRQGQPCGHSVGLRYQPWGLPTLAATPSRLTPRASPAGSYGHASSDRRQSCNSEVTVRPKLIACVSYFTLRAPRQRQARAGREGTMRVSSFAIVVALIVAVTIDRLRLRLQESAE